MLRKVAVDALGLGAPDIAIARQSCCLTLGGLDKDTGQTGVNQAITVKQERNDDAHQRRDE